MTDEELGFVAAICAEPGDDTARLAYADWLDDHAGEVPSAGRAERAELIRVQCRLAALGGCRSNFWVGLNCHCDFCRAGGVDLERREFRLLTDYDEFPWRRLPWGTAPRSSVSRGFLGSMTCTADQLLAYGDALLWRPTTPQVCGVCAGKGGHIYVTGDQEPSPANCMSYREYRWAAGSGWRAEATTVYRECPNCEGRRWVTGPGRCPPTALPITRVEVTTELFWAARLDGRTLFVFYRDPLNIALPAKDVGDAGGDPDVPNTVIKAMLGMRWPGVEFVVPTAGVHS